MTTHSEAEDQSKPARRPRGHRTPLTDLKIWTLHEQGRTLSQIAAEVNLDYCVVQKTIKKGMEEFIASKPELIEAVVYFEVSVLRNNISELLGAWKKSCGPQKVGKKVTRTTGGRGDKDPAVEETTETMEVSEQSGDVAYMVEVRHQLAELSKLVGADAPIRTESRITTDSTVRGVNTDSMTDEQLRAIIAFGSRVPELGQPGGGGALGEPDEGAAGGVREDEEGRGEVAGEA